MPAPAAHVAEPKVDIVIPVYNEHENIGATLELIVRDVTVPYSISLVYDRDDDTTLPAARATAERLGVSIELIKNHYGKGALNAIKTGLHATRNEYVVVTMADLSDPPSVINTMYQEAQTHSADVICGSRYMRGGSQEGGPKIKSLMSRTAGLTLHWFARLPTHDATNSFKLYRRRVIEALTIESQGGFELGLEIVVKAWAAGFRVSEVPTWWRDRTAGQSRFQLLEWLPSYLKWYFLAYRQLLARRPSH